jgi:hypothetical protein
VFGARRIECLSFIVDGKGIQINPKRKQGIMDIQKPRDITGLRSFLGAANQFRAFVNNYAMVTKPMTMLTGGHGQDLIQWSPEAHEAFDTVKKAIRQAPIIAHADPRYPLVTRSDASAVGVGGMLLQRIDGKEYVISYVSRAFTATESNWTTMEQEAYAFYFTIVKHDHWLLGVPFIAETDHANLIFMTQATSPKVVRWRTLLQSFDFQVVHIPGSTKTSCPICCRDVWWPVQRRGGRRGQGSTRSSQRRGKGRRPSRRGTT